VQRERRRPMSPRRRAGGGRDEDGEVWGRARLGMERGGDAPAAGMRAARRRRAEAAAWAKSRDGESWERLDGWVSFF